MSTVTAAKTITWVGQSGRQYVYEIYPIGTKFSAVPGNYIFAKETQPKSFKAVYIGETQDLSERFDNHHKMRCIQRNNATHIHVHGNSQGQVARREEESDLIPKWLPTCNG